MGSYHSLLSSLIAYHQQTGSSENEQDVTFVKVLARVMGKNLIKKVLQIQHSQLVQAASH